MTQIQTYISHNTRETLHIARKMGETITAPSVILLSGDLGSGKTLFTRGICIGLGLKEIWEVDSPTYTLMNKYPTNPPVFHFDLYRIGDDTELEGLSFFDIMDSDAIKIVEWPERLWSYQLTQNGFLVHLTKTGPSQRNIKIKAVKKEI